MLTLTKQQIEIMEYVAQGLSNKEIAKTMYLSESCIKLQIHNVLQKLDVNNRVKAVLIFLKEYKHIDLKGI